MNLDVPEHYGRLRRDLPNWARLVDKLEERVFTSGDVAKVTGVTRRMLHEWDRLEILYTLYRGTAFPRKQREAAGWKLYSIYDMWTLAVFQNLRDWGTWLAKLRRVRGKPRPDTPVELMKKPFGGSSGWFYGHTVPELLYRATFYWVYRHPVYLFIGENFVGFAPAERQGKDRRPNGSPWWKVDFYDDPTKKQFHVIRLLPLMDKVTTTLSRADFKIFVTPIEELEARAQAAPKSVLPAMWDTHVHFEIESDRLELEPLQGDQ